MFPIIRHPASPARRIVLIESLEPITSTNASPGIPIQCPCSAINRGLEISPYFYR